MTETSPVTFQGFASDSLAVRTGTIGFPANHVEVPTLLDHHEPSDERAVFLLFPRLQLWTPRVVLWRQEWRLVFVIVLPLLLYTIVLTGATKLVSCAHLLDKLGRHFNFCLMKGELVTRGYSTMLGYWGDKAKTEEVIGQDRWFHTG